MAETPIGEVLLKNVRLSFADIYKAAKERKDPKTGEMIQGKFKANGLMEKDTPDTNANMKKLKKASEEVKKAKWGEKVPKLKANQVCLRDGNEEDWDGYEGCWYISASNQTPPVLITRRKDRDGKWIPAKPGEIYSGCYVNLLVRLWAQDHPEYGKRLNASLEAVQFVEHGEPFSGGGPIDPNEKFAEIEADDGEDMDAGDDDDGVSAFI